jgi:hypothetical protein
LAAAVWLIVLGAIAGVVSPLFKNFGGLGLDDWDQMAAHRYLVVKSLREFGQFPSWNPYSCGGHAAWGAIEGDTVVVSPWLPVYLAAPIGVALRLEVVGMAVISAVGTWLLAGRFTANPVARALACVLWVANGRWALQIAAGHTWHLYYAWTPWALWFFDRAVWGRKPGENAKLADVIGAGVALALQVYSGAIYPLPQTALFVVVYACFCAVRRRSWKPIGLTAVVGLVAVGLSAPKLLPILETLRRFPRLIDSPEAIDLQLMVASLTSRDQTLYSLPAPVPAWRWHEYGEYVGVVGVVLLLAGALAARGPRARSWLWSAVLLFLLSLGNYGDWSPWGFLHEHVPVFKSQHVPSRWLHPCVLAFAVLAAGCVGRLLDRAARASPSRWPGRLALVGALGLTVFLAGDVASVARRSLGGTLSYALPAYHPSGQFHIEVEPPPSHYYRGYSSDVPALPAMMENIGAIDCWMFPPYISYYRSSITGRIPGQGARGKGDPEYRGETYLLGADGSTAREWWSPNAVAVHYEGAHPGDLIVLNQNWDPGWSANGDPAVDSRGAVAARAPGSSGEIVFRYRPAGAGLGLALFALTLASLLIAARWRRVVTRLRRR